MLTNKRPNKPGYYWWTDGCERLQVLEVRGDGDQLWAEGEEVCFNIKLCDEDDLWEFIKPPRLPKRKNLTDDGV